MAVPKRKTSCSKRNMRRAHDSINPTNHHTCSNCGEIKRPHNICDACGHYDKKEVLKADKK